MSEVKGAAMELGTERIRKLLVQYAVPAIIAMTASSLYNMVDSIFIGHGVGGAGHFGAGPDVPADEPRGGVRFVGGCGRRDAGVDAPGAAGLRNGPADSGECRGAQPDYRNLFRVADAGFSRSDSLLFRSQRCDDRLCREYMSVILWGNVVTHMYLGLNAVLRAAGHRARRCTPRS